MSERLHHSENNGITDMDEGMKVVEVVSVRVVWRMVRENSPAMGF